MEVLDGEIGRLVDVPVPERHREGALLQSRPLTERAGRDPHILLVFRLHLLGEALPVAAVHIGEETLEGHVMDIALSELRLIVDRDLFALCAVENGAARFLREIPEGGVQTEMIALRECKEHGVAEAPAVL